MSKNHHFNSGVFKKEIWVANKTVFEKLIEIDVEFESGDEWSWVIANASGELVKKIPGGGSGWHSLHLPSQGLYGNFSIGFQSNTLTNKIIKQGDVTFG